MTAFTENIRKMMGWCPNVNAFETRKPVQFDNTSAGASGGVRGFSRKISEMLGIKGALVIVGISAILNALGVYMTAGKIAYVFEGNQGNEIESMIGRMSFMDTLTGALGWSLILWLAGTGIIHLLSKALGGKGKSYPWMLTVVGYSFIPLIFGSLINLGLLFMIEPMTLKISPGNPMDYRELYGNSYIFASVIVSLFMQALVSIILFFGVRSAHKLPFAKSAVVAGIPFMFSVLSAAWTFRSAGMI